MPPVVSFSSEKNLLNASICLAVMMLSLALCWTRITVGVWDIFLKMQRARSQNNDLKGAKMLCKPKGSCRAYTAVASSSLFL